MRPPRPRRGFTLVELAVSVAATAIVLLIVFAAVSSQQRTFYSGQKLRTAQENARTALVYLEQKLPLAGWGMDPSLAIDFQFYTGPCPTTTAPPMTCPATRDATGDADELVFYARNPGYWVPAGTTTGSYRGRAWNLAAISDASVTLAARTGDTFRAGQILQVVCPGTLNYAYFTLAQNATATADADLTINLAPVDPGNPFQRQDTASGMVDCRVFQIDRYRFHVRPVPLSGNRFVPYLVLDRGVDVTGNSDGTPDGVVDDKDEVFIAEGIEGFQVAYLFPNPALGRAGGTAGTAITFSAANADQTATGALTNEIATTNFTGAAPATAGETVYTQSSFYQYGYSDAMRQTYHQANIRAVEIALVARSPEPDLSAATNLVVDSNFRLLNQSGAPPWITGSPVNSSGTDGYQRIRMDATVDLPNMTVRSIPGF